MTSLNNNIEKRNLELFKGTKSSISPEHARSDNGAFRQLKKAKVK